MSSDLLPAPSVEPQSPEQPPRKHRRRGTSHTSLAAQGEPMIWLTGGALAVALLMISVLLVHVLWEGAGTFWPSVVTRFELVDGTAYMGELSATDDYRPTPQMLDELASNDPAAAERLQQSLSDDGEVQRRQLRVGNFELTQTHFVWVDDYQLKADAQSQPEWALVLERLEWGRFYGVPVRFVETRPAEKNEDWQKLASQQQQVELVLEDGTTKPLAERASDDAVASIRQVWSGAEATWQKFLEQHDAIRQRWEERTSLATHESGHLSRQNDDARLRLAGVRMEYCADSPEYAAEQERYEAVLAETSEGTAEVNARIAELDELNSRYEMVLQTAAGEEASILLANIVRAYPANQLSLVNKLGVYFSRWGEFLTDNPREANSEGGVFPAIWGTVVMTLLMSILVVPFGVLAALYLREYAKAGPIVSVVRIAINNLAGVPSIVFGVFGLGFFCYNVGYFVDMGPAEPWSAGAWWGVLGILALIAVAGVAVAMFTGQTPHRPRASWAGWAVSAIWLAALVLTILLVVKTPYFDGFFRTRYLEDNKATFGTGGLLWASLTLALLTLPVVIVATEEALAAVPNSMREGSYACGASKWQTIRRIVLPRAMPGIMTGMILAMARGAGEVAPLMLVGVQKLAPELPVDSTFPFVHPQRSFMHLGFQIYDVGFQSQNSEAAKPVVYTTTLLLIGLIALLNIAAIALRTRLRRKFVSTQF